jgi:hypothetical protein
MKHMTYSDRSLLVGDEAADLAIAYAVVLGRNATIDTVTLNAISADGNEVRATFLLHMGTVMAVQTASSRLPEPDNASAVSYMRAQMERLTIPRPVSPDPDPYDYPEDLVL